MAIVSCDLGSLPAQPVKEPTTFARRSFLLRRESGRCVALSFIIMVRMLKSSLDRDDLTLRWRLTGDGPDAGQAARASSPTQVIANPLSQPTTRVTRSQTVQDVNDRRIRAQRGLIVLVEAQTTGCPFRMRAVCVAMIIVGLASSKVASGQETTSFGPREAAAIERLFDGYAAAFSNQDYTKLREFVQAPFVPVRSVQHPRAGRLCGTGLSCKRWTKRSGSFVLLRTR